MIDSAADDGWIYGHVGQLCDMASDMGGFD